MTFICKVYGDKEPPATDTILTCAYDGLLKLVQRFGENVGLKLSPKYFRKIGRTRCAPIIGEDALFKMAGWALKGVGRNYVLPSPEDTLKCYLQIEHLLTFEPKAVTDKEQARQNIVNFMVTQGVPMETAKQMAAIWRSKALDPEQAAIEARKVIKQVQPVGMLNSEQVAERQFARILIGALKLVKKEMKNSP
jgi:hypothetical protein